MTSSSSDVLKDKVPSKDLAWWIPNIDHKITPEVRDTLETYSNIPSSQVKEHVYTIREKAWFIRPWPCTGLGGFFSPTLPRLSMYPLLISSLKAGSKLLDVGCYCGTDLRRLFIDGCPQENLCGTDFINHWGVGFDLFCDEATFGVKYVETDILNPSADLLSLNGTFDFVSAVHFLHNWDWATQIRACTTISVLTKPGSKVIGLQVGTHSADTATWISSTPKEGFTPHSVESFGKLWDEVGELTNTRWETKANMRGWDSVGYGPEETQYLGKEAGILEFVVTRV